MVRARSSDLYPDKSASFHAGYEKCNQFLNDWKTFYTGYQFSMRCDVRGYVLKEYVEGFRTNYDQYSCSQHLMSLSLESWSEKYDSPCTHIKTFRGRNWHEFLLASWK